MPKTASQSAKSTSQAIAESRREEIVSAAVTLFAERGYFQTKIEDISNKIGVGKGLIYRYFKDKTDVLFFALRSVLEKYGQEEVPRLLETLGSLAAVIKILEINCRLAEQHPQETVLAYRSTKELTAEQRGAIQNIETDIIAEIQQVLERCIDDGLMEPVNARFLAYQYVMFGHTWALKHWALRRELTMENYLAEGVKTLVVPFLTASGRKAYARMNSDVKAASA